MSRSLLFVVSRRSYYGDYSTGSGYPWSKNSGIYNSVLFVSEMLTASGIPSSIVQVQDQNAIDAAVAKARPTDVVIEAIWVMPAKLAVLAKKYPSIRWFVRNHSEVPFLANEGMAFTDLLGYLSNSAVFLASNSLRAVRDIRGTVQAWQPHWDTATIASRVVYLPNYYPLPAPLAPIPATFGVLNVGCFGAIRPLKNQVYEALAALELSRRLGKRLLFHINSTRLEGMGQNVLKNLQVIFSGTPNAQLVMHPWLDRPKFLDLCRRMDIGFQVSFTETFNIVTADLVTENTPVVVSPEIDWVDPRFQADPTNRDDMIAKARQALSWAAAGAVINRTGLTRYDAQSRQAWLREFGGVPSHGWHAEHRQFVAQPVIVSHRGHK